MLPLVVVVVIKAAAEVAARVKLDTLVAVELTAPGEMVVMD